MSCQSVCLWRLRAIARMKSDLDAIRVPLILEINGAVSFRKSSRSDGILVEADIHQVLVTMYNSVFVFSQTGHFQGPVITVHSKVDCISVLRSW